MEALHKIIMFNGNFLDLLSYGRFVVVPIDIFESLVDTTRKLYNENWKPPDPKLSKRTHVCGSLVMGSQVPHMLASPNFWASRQY